MFNKKTISLCMCIGVGVSMIGWQQTSAFAFSNGEISSFVSGRSECYYTDASGITWFYMPNDESGNIIILGASKPANYMEVPEKINGKIVDTVYGIVLDNKVCPNKDVKEVEKVKIPSNVTYIDKAAFTNLVGVKEAEIPEKLNDGSINFARSSGILINGKSDPGQNTNSAQFDPKNIGWNEFDGHKYYFDADKGYVTGWKNIDGKDYYFYSNGQMATAFIDLNGTKYYFDPVDGVLKYGWQKINNSWYYFSTEAEGTKVKGFMKTAWFYNNGNWYYFYSDGTMATGFINLNGAYYYLDESNTSSVGVMKTGWQRINGKWYYFNTSSDSGIEGMMKKGWNYIGGNWYYFYPSNGQMAEATWVDGYYVNASGACQ